MTTRRSNQITASAGGSSWPPLRPPAAPSRLISEREFSAVYSAAAFAIEQGMPLDTMVTIAWQKFGADVEARASAYWMKYLKCLRDWLDERGLPVAWIYAHEHGPTIGLHTHVAIHLAEHPDGARKEFRAWSQAWAARQVGQAVPRGVRVTGHSIAETWHHWRTVNYLLKGYDRSAIVQHGAVAPDGRDVLLGDLIAFAWRDPGPIAMARRVGWSQTLGQQQRKIGRHPKFEQDLMPAPAAMWKDFDLLPPKPLEGPKPIRQSTKGWTRPTPFLSAYELGWRDVRRLYPQEFIDRIGPSLPTDDSDSPGADQSKNGLATPAAACASEHLPVFMWHADAEGRCIAMNRALREFFGVPVPQPLYSWPSTELADLVAKNLKPGDGFAFRQAFYDANGAIRVLEMHAETWTTEAGTFGGLSAICFEAA